MPRGPNGDFTLTNAPFGANTRAVAGEVNAKFDEVSAALTDSVSRSGRGRMQVDLDVAGHKVTGLAAGEAAADAATMAQLTAGDAALSARVDAEISARQQGDAANAATLAGLLPRDGSRAMAGDFNMGGYRVRFALGAQVNLGTDAPDAPSHFRAAGALGTAAGDGAAVASFEALTSNRDRLFMQASRAAAGASWETAEWSLRRFVDTTAFGALQFPSSGGAALSGSPGDRTVWARGDRALQVCAPSLVNAAAGGTADGTSFYPANGTGAGTGVAHFSKAAAHNQDTVVVIRRRPVDSSNFTDGPLVSFFSDGRYSGGIISSAGNQVAYQTSSDYRLKQDARPVEGALDAVRSVQAKTFEFRASPGRRVMGFLAHEAQRVAPDAVSGEKDGTDGEGRPVYQGLDQSRLVPLLWAAAQELAARVEALEARLAQPDRGRG